MSERLEIRVHGSPAPGGSKRGFVNPHTDRVVITEDNRRAKPWKQAVIDAALKVKDEVLTGPVCCYVTFYVRRPRGHFGTGRRAGLLRPSAPLHPTTRPDATKLWRPVEDALTEAGVWRDDAQVVDQHVRKEYATEHEPEGCEVIITALPEAVGDVVAEGQAQLAAA